MRGDSDAKGKGTHVFICTVCGLRATQRLDLFFVIYTLAVCCPCLAFGAVKNQGVDALP